MLKVLVRRSLTSRVRTGGYRGSAAEGCAVLGAAADVQLEVAVEIFGGAVKSGFVGSAVNVLSPGRGPPAAPDRDRSCR